MGFKEQLKENFANVRSFQDLKYVDRRILIVGGTVFFVVLGLYYYYLIAIYLPHKQAIRDKAAAEATQQQAKQQAQIKKAAEVSMNSSMTPSNKSDIPQQSKPEQNQAVDIFKIPGNYMDISKIPPASSSMYLNSFDVLYDYLNLAFQGNYSKAYEYLNKDFVKINNITLDSFSNYYNNIYFKQNTFYIFNVHSEGTSYITDVTINDKEHAGAAFNATYKLVNNNGKYSIILDDLASYVKSGIENQQ